MKNPFPSLFVLVGLLTGLIRCSSAAPPPVTPDGLALQGMLNELLAVGPRNLRNPEALTAAKSFIETYWTQLGGKVVLQSYEVEGQVVHNIALHLGPDQGPVWVVGAHYDVASNMPGADDNGSGTVGLMLLGKKLLEHAGQLTTPIRLVAFTLEEPPYFQTPHMGSVHYAKSLRQEGLEVKGMIALEMIGYYRNEPGSQSFPEPFPGGDPPTVGNFICLVGRENERDLITQLHTLMDSGPDLPIFPLAADPDIPGISFSDHHSFWEQGFPAVMLTDTAFYRNPHYHRRSDKAETLHFDTMATLIQSLHRTLLSLAGPPAEAPPSP